MTEKINKNPLRSIILIQLAIIFIFILVIVIRVHKPFSLAIDMSTCNKGLAEYEGGDFSFNGSGNDILEVSDLLTTPSFSLDSGSYTLIIDYSATEDQMFRIMDAQYTDWIKYPTGYLRRSDTKLYYDFSTAVDLGNANVTIQYIPTGGSISIYGISIVSNVKGFIKWLLGFLCVFILFDLAYINRSGLLSKRNNVLALTGLILLTSLPLTVSGINGMDLPYSLLRVEGLYKTLVSGQFPARLNTFILDGAGYPGSIFYGDIFLYPAALLRMLGMDVTGAWKVYVFLLNIATVLIAYFCFKKISHTDKAALIMTFAYCSAPFHLEAVYYRAALGEMVAYVFLPVIAYSLFEIYTCELGSDNIRTLSTSLAFGLSAVLCSHLLSTEMLGLMLLILIIILYKKSFTPEVLITFFRAGIKTILISLYYLIPFIDYFLNVPTRISDTVTEELIPIQERGTNISELFSFLTFFEKGGRVPFNPDGPGLILIAAFIFGCVLWIQSKADRRLKICLIMSAIAMFMASDLFPWDYIIAHSAIGRIMSQIQHPTRYLSLVVICTVVLLCNILKSRNERTVRLCLEVVICFTIFTMSVFSSQYESTMTPNHPVNSSDLDSLAVGNAEYALSGSDIFKNAYAIASENNKGHVTSMINQGINMIANCNSGEASVNLLLPRYNYKYIHVYDEAGHRFEARSGHDMGGNDNNLISVTLPAGYNGNIYLRFDEPLSWRLAELISLAAIIFLICKRSKIK